VQSAAETLAWLVDRADQLAQRVAVSAPGELMVLARSLADQRRQGDDSPELLATALATSREALQRASALEVTSSVVAEAAAAIMGGIRTIQDVRDRRAAFVMTLHWHGLAGVGAHFVSWDEAAAAEARTLFDSAGTLLGCASGLVTRSMTAEARRSAYGATVTFGPYDEMAADYLRDNLHDSPSDLVQRGLHAAVADGVNNSMVARALVHIAINVPRPLMAVSASIQVATANFRRNFDYRVDQKRQAVIFSGAGIARLKAMVGWNDIPSLTAVERAQRIERLIEEREGIEGARERDTIAEISVLGYLRCYAIFSGFSSNGRTAETLDSLLENREKDIPELRELGLERLIDSQRSSIYSYRQRVRAEVEPIPLVGSIAKEAVSTWVADGKDSLVAGVSDLLAGHADAQRISRALDETSSGDMATRATVLVEDAVLRRSNQLTNIEFTAFVRRVLLVVVDTQWRRHLGRVRFLQRQSSGLYHPDSESTESRNADVATLFSATEQAIQRDSIKYLLNAAL
jgi:preprotein translocase subunit SecA